MERELREAVNRVCHINGWSAVGDGCVLGVLRLGEFGDDSTSFAVAI